MLSWCGARGGFGRDGFIMLLRNDGRVVRGAWSETLCDEQLMQVDQRSERDARGADRHARAGGRIQHPRSHHRDHAGPCLDMDDLTGGPPLAVLTTHPLPIERMPAIVDDDLLPEMGRMTLRWPWAARTPCSPGRMPGRVIGRSSPA